MINTKNILALIPARGGSKGLPGKNVLPLNGKPLIAWPISAALNSNYIDKIVVSTDSSEIRKIAVEYGAECPFIRPSEFATDTANSISVVEHAIQYLNDAGESFDYVVLLEPTSPLTEASDIDSALEKLISNRELADSIVGVSSVEARHPTFNYLMNKDGVLKSYLTKKADDYTRRQDLAALYFIEGSLYISDIQTIRNKHSFYHDRTIGYIVPRWKAFEVDEIVDMICIEAIMKNLNRIREAE